MQPPTCARRASSLGPLRVSGKRAGPPALPSAPLPSVCTPSPLTSRAGVSSAYKPRPLGGARSQRGILGRCKLYPASLHSAAQHLLLHSGVPTSQVMPPTLGPPNRCVPSTLPIASSGRTGRGTRSAGWKRSSNRSTRGRSDPPQSSNAYTNVRSRTFALELGCGRPMRVLVNLDTRAQGCTQILCSEPEFQLWSKEGGWQGRAGVRM